jgi:hypothetical protein
MLLDAPPDSLIFLQPLPQLKCFLGGDTIIVRVCGAALLATHLVGDTLLAFGGCFRPERAVYMFRRRLRPCELAGFEFCGVEGCENLEYRWRRRTASGGDTYCLGGPRMLGGQASIRRVSTVLALRLPEIIINRRLSGEHKVESKKSVRIFRIEAPRFSSAFSPLSP